MKSSRKDFSTIFGTIQIIDNKKRFVPKSPAHMQVVISRLPFNLNIACTFSAAVASRSDSQLAYHFVLMGYIAEHTGYTKEEVHDAIMRDKFGVKRIKVGNIIQDVRQSISEKALFPKSDMVELIEHDLSLCKELNIKVPTAEELGYIPNNKPMK